MRRAWGALASTVALVGTLVVACSDGGNPAQLGGGNTNPEAGSTDPCALPNQGCSCKGEGLTVDCGEVTTRSGDYVTCSEGKRTCTAGTWSACVGDHTVFKSLGSFGPPVHVQNYGTPVACTNNPCDPSCSTVPDDSTGVDAGGLVPIDGGWTLADATPPPDANLSLCQGLQCQIVNCADGGLNGTTITGTVYDPASLNPIYDALVAVPNGPVPLPPTGVPRPAGACGGVTLPPVVTYTNTAHNGTFTLTGVPAGSNIPILIQSGQWQRVVNINVTACTTKNISTSCNGLNNYAGSAACVTRLPRTKAEGNIPKIAIATGGLDAMECLLDRIGISTSEFTDENGAGRVHVFNDEGATLPGGANHDLSYLLGFTCPSGVGKCPGTSGSSIAGFTNPSFETGTLAGYISTGTTSATNTQASSGSWSALLGSGPGGAKSNTSTIAQTFVAPAGAATLSFDVRVVCPGGSNGFSFSLHDNTANTTASLGRTCTNSGSFGTATSAGIVAGDNYTLTITNLDSSALATQRTYTYVDNLQWLMQPAPLTNNYDLIMLPCDGGGEYSSANWTGNYDDWGRKNLVNYANIGGRIFSSHWGREWIDRASTTFTNGPFPGVAPWFADGNPAYGGFSDPLTGYIDSTTTRGQDFSQWMAVTTGSGATFQITPSRFDAAANLPAGSTRFVYGWSDNSGPGGHGSTPDSVMDFTFDTPIGGNALGRVMFTDMHLASGNPSGNFPGNCPTQGTALTSQEKAAEYLLFDLGACVGTQLPPPVVAPPVWYYPASISRQYNPTCGAGQHVVWRFFYWEDSIPAAPDGGTAANIIFSVQTATTQAGLATAGIAPLATVTTTNLSFVGADVGAALATLPSLSMDWLQVNMTLNPASDHQSAPTLLAWQLTYDCVDSE